MATVRVRYILWNTDPGNYRPGRNNSNFWEMLFWRSITSRLCKGASWNYFKPFYLFFRWKNYKADANLMMMVFSLACYKHAKGFGECALLGLQVLQVFNNERVILLRGRHFGALPSRLPAALAKQNKRFVSSRSTWRERPRGENKRYPLKQ